MASVDWRLENGVTSTTDPAWMLSTDPPGWKNLGAEALVLVAGIAGITETRPATSNAEVPTRQRRAG
jgi:hypothetical protein